MSPFEQKEMLTEFALVEGAERIKFMQRLISRLLKKEEWKQALKLCNIFCDHFPKDMEVLSTVLNATTEYRDVNIIANFRVILVSKIESLVGPLK